MRLTLIVPKLNAIVLLRTFIRILFTSIYKYYLHNFLIIEALNFFLMLFNHLVHTILTDLLLPAVCDCGCWESVHLSA